MQSILNLYINALLSDAAYVGGLSDLLTESQLATRLADRMTPELARSIAANFEVVSQIDSNDDLSGGASGFDATAWRGREGSPFAGRVFVSMRGTEGGQDFLADGRLAFTGNAGQQVIDMMNWWLAITTAAGQPARQFRIASDPVTSELFPVRAADAVGTGRISAGDVARGLEVNGHSLGGYLAAAFTRVFGTQANVTQTTTFNSAGFAPGSETVFTLIAEALGPGYGRSAFPGPRDASQLNVFAVHGLNLTTNTLWFEQTGVRVALFNELSGLFGSDVPNHFMYKLTDALAL